MGKKLNCPAAAGIGLYRTMGSEVKIIFAIHEGPTEVGGNADEQDAGEEGELETET